jgi:zinc-RING finger domain
MSLVEKEGCPVCWREYGLGTVPTSVSCGHSFCADCISQLRACPLCRKRITSTSQRTTNYSLLSLANRVNAMAPVETRDQEVQATPASRRRTNINNQSAELQSTQANQKPIKFKFARHPTGALRSLEVVLS